MRVLEFCEEKSFSHHTKNNVLALSSCHVKICSSGSPNASDISMLSSGLKNVLTTSHPAVRELIQTPVVNKPSNQLRIQFLFPFPGNCGFPLSFKDLQHFHSSQQPAATFWGPKTSRSGTQGSKKNPRGTHGTWRSLATGKLVPSQGLKASWKCPRVDTLEEHSLPWKNPGKLRVGSPASGGGLQDSLQTFNTP